jgi:hypothetical protein
MLKYLELSEFTDALVLPSDSWVDPLHFYELVCIPFPSRITNTSFVGSEIVSLHLDYSLYPRPVGFYRSDGCLSGQIDQAHDCSHHVLSRDVPPRSLGVGGGLDTTSDIKECK